ncbi:MAG TPA: bifunctional pyr operon transcriptional regulator/uracil phosphoribosyltransferase PyrR [Firmicutes bacterium]|nr:bifunctional pyr operon transcriptional regulator/uracil phosphoribosyltransferase PyrR [Bacillota bacterium]
MSLTAQIMDEKAVSRAITRICYEIVEKNRGSEGICIVGIFTRGAYLAQRIAGKISELEQRKIPIGYLDITPYRDDVSRDKPIQDRTQLDFDIQDKKVVLVDDVLYTGRSVRAAIDALMARGRPDKIQLAALIDRGHRELPLRPDFIGKNVPTSREEKVIVRLKEADGIDQVTIIKETEETK